MNRTVGVALRRSVGGATVLTVVVTALSSMPQTAVVAAASGGGIASLPLTGPRVRHEIPSPAMPRPAVLIYTEYVPAPPAPALAGRISVSRPNSAHLISPASYQPALPVSGPVWGRPNGFAFGHCTWWVAQRRYVPWRGNAYQWWWNARAFGDREGWTPRAGAIMVMGVSSSSPLGHVAYVERVNRDGSFVVSEMNWWGVPGGGWDRVDYRTIRSMRGILGFIY